MNEKFKIGDIVKITSVTENDRIQNVNAGDIAIITYNNGYGEYVANIVEEAYNDANKRYSYKNIKEHYYLDVDQLELYRGRFVTSILYACGVNSEIIELTTTELLDYITETYDVSIW